MKNAGLRRRFPSPAEMAAVLFVHCECRPGRARTAGALKTGSAGRWPATSGSAIAGQRPALLIKKNAGLRRRFPFPAERAAVLFVHCEAGQDARELLAR
ncbi:hypothetical protein J3A72_000226 [Stenotrophomonas sp. PvP093]|uniref:hypothetical protein n=1 Tax=Stenotrophomonas sp. PvP093 TaxID=2817856 RepID=UPI000A59B44F|nr:hypothetical protein [Stenotrophomonas sp. PvP093]MBP2479950.1 hypothetical protein [Stenotrophomonas sp. PvP093]MCF3547205.1 hypothetical protein [Stenotrophomonas maltophilia]